MHTSFSASALPHTQGMIPSPIPTSLRTMLATLHTYYPGVALTAEWVTTHAHQMVVRALILHHGHVLASAMAASEAIETAEDEAKLRAIAALLAQHHSNMPVSVDSARPYPSTTSIPTPTSTDVQVSPSTPSPAPIPSSLGAAVASQSNIATTTNFSALGPSSPPETNDFAAETPLSPVSAGSDYTAPMTSTASTVRPDIAQPPLSLHSPDDSDKPIDLIKEEDMVASPMEQEPAEVLSPEALSQPFLPADPSPEQAAETSTPTPRAKSQKRSASKASAKKASSSNTSTTQPLAQPSSAVSDESMSLDLSDIIAKTSVELNRLGWTNSQGRAHLQKVYGKRSRQQLTDPELIDFLQYLESQPSPAKS